MTARIAWSASRLSPYTQTASQELMCVLMPRSRRSEVGVGAW